MGKLRDDPQHRHHHQSFKITQKANMIKGHKKTLKITYISSPLLVRACDAADFRELVQQLTGKDSGPHHDHHATTSFSNKEPPTFYSTRATQQYEAPSLSATEATEEGKGSFFDDNSMDSLEFDEAYFWKEVAYSVLHPPCVLV